MTDTELPDALQYLLTTALDHGLGLLPQGTPVVPFVLVDHGGRLELKRFWTGELAESQELARAWLREQDGLRYGCVAWDATLTTDDGAVDAICVDGSDDSGADGWVAAQRYVPAESEQGWVADGDPVLLGRSTPVLAS